ncbi:MAG: DUF4870 domain-containing protein [Candidatus Pacebacteria bacterium]|jgi:uncharacterized membrane protein|nr:DUF4870 domain-containing protein [Candidatus Paceibacterota bacterium]
MPPSSSNGDMPQTTPPTPAGDDTTLMGVLAYIGPLVIVPYLMAKDNAFVQFHVKQGFVLFGIELAIYVVSGFIFYSIMMLYPILSLFNLGCLILSIIGIVYVVQRKEEQLPLVGALAKHVPF